jgi:hypothetical protein
MNSSFILMRSMTYVTGFWIKIYIIGWFSHFLLWNHSTMLNKSFLGGLLSRLCMTASSSIQDIDFFLDLTITALFAVKICFVQNKCTYDLCGTLVSVITLCVVYCGFNPWLSHTKDYKTGIWGFSTKVYSTMEQDRLVQSGCVQMEGYVFLWTVVSVS